MHKCTHLELDLVEELERQKRSLELASSKLFLSCSRLEMLNKLHLSGVSYKMHMKKLMQVADRKAQQRLHAARLQDTKFFHISEDARKCVVVSMFVCARI